MNDMSSGPLEGSEVERMAAESSGTLLKGFKGIHTCLKAKTQGSCRQAISSTVNQHLCSKIL